MIITLTSKINFLIKFNKDGILIIKIIFIIFYEQIYQFNPLNEQSFF